MSSVQLRPFGSRHICNPLPVARMRSSAPCFFSPETHAVTSMRNHPESVPGRDAREALMLQLPLPKLPLSTMHISIGQESQHTLHGLDRGNSHHACIDRIVALHGHPSMQSQYGGKKALLQSSSSSSWILGFRCTIEHRCKIEILLHAAFSTQQEGGA